MKLRLSSSRGLSGLAGIVLLMGGVVLQVAAPAAVAAPPVINIGVDHSMPSPCASAPTGTRPPLCHNFTYDDFFPNGVTTPTITVHSGDVVSFSIDPQAFDGFHTATLLKPGETSVSATLLPGAPFPLIVTDTDTGDAPGQVQLNPAVLSPTNPACGQSASAPCPYDGSSEVNSGALTPGAPPAFFQVNAAPGTIVPFVCLIHPNMVGRLSVVPTATATTTQADLNTRANDQYLAETSDALAAEAALNAAGAAHKPNANGTTNWTLTAGADGANGDTNVQLLEMLPSTLTIKPGDTVTWISPSHAEPHTVTWPHSEKLTIGSAFEAFPAVCEGPAGDTPATAGPPLFGCGAPGSATGAEFHGNFAPMGPSSIANPVTQATSGVFASFPLGASPITSTSFSFPNQNSFSYMCTIHDHMFGVVNVVGSPGYREVAQDGGVFAFGASGFFGSLGGTKLNKPVVGGANTPDGKGYWAVASDGGVFSFGNAGFFGSAGSLKLNKPIVGMAPTPDGGGYWLFASDGGVFTYGDAKFSGSTGSIRLNKPVVGGASSPDGFGYHMVASDGGIFSFGDAEFHGSAGSLTLNKPVVGMAETPSGGGYFLVASDGGIFTYGDAGFFGSAGSLKLNKPVVGISPTITGLGYYLVASDGGIFNYGDSTFVGSQGGSPLNSPVVGMFR